MGFILFIVALLLSLVLVPAGLITTLIMAFYKRKLRTGFRYLNESFYSMAYSIDQFGNVVCADLFDLTLIKKQSEHTFGNPDETISSVLGKNKLAGTLTFTGKMLDKILHLLDNNHSIKSIEQ